MLLVIEVKRQADIGFMFAIKPGAHVGFTLATLGALLGLAGAPGVAAQVCAAAEALLEQLGTPVPDPYKVLYTTNLLRIKAQIDATIWTENWTRGRMLALEEAVALALEEYEQVWPRVQQASDQQQ